ncbi:MAG TPA: LysR family transcriptional regulator [Firmicutes bacterium]|nr:LysR family transcriptional regulator [Bacillota bacterium]
MDLRHLITFKSIVDNGSFSNAALKLGYTQSTITSQIQQLEQELSIKLFEKIGRKMVLTPVGKELVPYTQELLNTIEKIKNMGKSSEHISGEIRIAIAESLMSYKLQNILSLFKQQAPNVKLSMMSLNCFVIKDNLMKDNADIGLFYDIGGLDENLTTIPLCEFPVVLVCSPLFELEKYDFCKPHQELNVNFIINEKDCIYRRIFEQYSRDHEILLNNTIELWSLETIKKCVASNLGISFLPRFVVEEELANHKLVEIKAGCTNTTIKAVCAYHKNKWVSPSMALFLRLVKEHFNYDI